MSHDWAKTSAADLGRQIEKGAIDPVDLTEYFLATSQDHPFAERTYARLTPQRARAEAKAASDRARAGLRRSPLDGVPISWKDLFDSAGTKTEAGSALLQGRTPDRDCAVLANATAAGLICIGKTHMSELAFSGLGLNPMTATPPCVNDHDAVPGGSSSGAAASVAFGMAAAGIGSDTGGSVRIPAAWNDLVGLKTSHGALSLSGVVPLCARFDTVGPLCRTVEDSALLFAAMQPADAAGKSVDITNSTMKNKRLAILDTTAMDEISDRPAAAFQSAVERLQAAGATVERIRVPQVETAMALTGVLYGSEAYGTWRTAIEAEPDKMFSQILARFRAGQSYSGPDFVDAWHQLEVIRQQWRDATGGFDAIIMPSSPIDPPNAQRLLEDDDYYLANNLLALRNTRIGNLMGLCSVSLPTGVPSCGIMLSAHAGQDRRLLRLCAAAEAALA